MYESIDLHACLTCGSSHNYGVTSENLHTIICCCHRCNNRLIVLWDSKHCGYLTWVYFSEAKTLISTVATTFCGMHNSMYASLYTR